MQSLSVRLVIVVLFVQLLFVTSALAQTQRLTDVEAAFNAIPSRPSIYHFQNTTFKPPKGGHLQGIQGWEESGREYIIITAGSAHFSYYVEASLSPEGRVTKLQRLLHKPYRHAGGNQWCEGRVAVGVEDNFAKDKSQVLLINVRDTSATAPVQKIIERSGTYKRSTAGATGFTTFNNGYLIAVADWDSRNIDFYYSKAGSPLHFDSIATFHARDKSDWCVYQNINLLTDSSGKIFLIGFGKKEGKSCAELFRLGFQNGVVQMAAISTRYFDCRKGASFRYGAGSAVRNNQLLLYSCQRSLKKKNAVNLFGDW